MLVSRQGSPSCSQGRHLRQSLPAAAGSEVSTEASDSNARIFETLISRRHFALAVRRFLITGSEAQGPSQLTQRSIPPRGVYDIDSLCSMLGCPDYAIPIFQHLRRAEVRPFKRPCTNTLRRIQQNESDDFI